MDTHTLELLEFDRLRQIVAGYSTSSLGRDACLGLEPLKNQAQVELRLQETEELLDLVRAGLGPPLGGLVDIRAEVRRAQTHATLSADELCQVANVLRVVQGVAIWIDRSTDNSPRLASFGVGLSDFTSLLNTMEGCLDARGEVLDTASRKLSNLRREIHLIEQKIQDSLKQLIRSLDARGLLRYPNYTMVGHHYVVPVIRERRGEVSGSVQRTSASNETVYIEPSSIADHSAQLSFVRDKEKSEIRRILHWLSEQIGLVGKDLLSAVDVLADLDFTLARARFAQDFRHHRPVFGTHGIFLRSARHPLLEHLFREEVLNVPSIEKNADDDDPSDSDSFESEQAAAEATSAESDSPSADIQNPKPAQAKPDIRFASLPVGLKSPAPAERPRKTKPPAPSPLFAQLPKGLAAESVPEPTADVPEETTDETDDASAEPLVAPTLKGGLGVDYVALAEQRRAEKKARQAAKVVYQRPVQRVEQKSYSVKTDSGLPRRKVTPIDIHLGFDFRFLVVTGPNTGGKTVALKCLGLISLMAQCGLFIPAAEGSQVTMLDDILADIGDEQSLEQSLSTFSSHMRRLTTILQTTTEKTLVLLDEVGAGTDPAEGAAIGRAIVDELDSIGCLAVITTHLGELKTIAFGNSRVRNANVEFDLESLKPLYHLRIGEAGQSHALAIARRLNLPGHVVDRAESFLKQNSGYSSQEFDNLQALRLDAEKARQEALQAQADSRRLQEELEKALAEQRGRDRKADELKAAREQLKIGDRVVIPRVGYDRPGLVAKLDFKKRSALVSIGHMKWDASIDELIPLEDSPAVPPPKPQYRTPR